MPWWFFGIIGGVLSVWLGEKFLAGQIGPSRAFPATMRLRWMPWAVGAAVFRPRRDCSAGSSAGSSSAGQCRLGPFFRAFNRVFDRVDRNLRRDRRRIAAPQRDRVVVYGGLLVLTYFEFVRTPTGFIPQQDKGYLLLNVQLPDSASVERTQTDDGPHRRHRRQNDRASPTRSASLASR